MQKPVRHIKITKEQAGQRIDNFIMRLFKSVPKSRIYRMLRKGEVRVNRSRVSPHYRIKEGDQMRLPPVRVKDTKQNRPPDRFLKTIRKSIIYEDEALIILNKPAGIAVHGGSDLSYGLIDAFPWLDQAYHSVNLVHRLDKETSGCLILARTRDALRHLHQQLRAQEVEKYYRALLKGQLLKSREINAPIKKRASISGERMVQVTPGGQPAQTLFTPARWFKEATFVEIQLITGRMHQIRAHASFAGHPVAGDDKYGDRAFNKHMKEFGLNRLFLHASTIRFDHPTKKKRLEISAPMDQALLNCLNQLD